MRNFILSCYYFRAFKEDGSKKEVCFPATLTRQERACVKLAAPDMGLRVESKEVRSMKMVMSLFSMLALPARVRFHSFLQVQ